MMNATCLKGKHGIGEKIMQKTLFSWRGQERDVQNRPL